MNPPPKKTIQVPPPHPAAYRTSSDYMAAYRHWKRTGQSAGG